MGSVRAQAMVSDITETAPSSQDLSNCEHIHLFIFTFDIQELLNIAHLSVPDMFIGV